MGETEAALRIAEAIIASVALKSGVARFLTCFASAKKRLECQVNADSHILKDLRVNRFERRTFCFQYRKRIDLFIAGQTFAFLLIGSLAFLKQVIVQPSALCKCLVKQSLLLLCRIQAILKVFMDSQISAQTEQGVKGHCPYPHHAPKGLASLPMAEARGLTLGMIIWEKRFPSLISRVILMLSIYQHCK